MSGEVIYLQMPSRTSEYAWKRITKWDAFHKTISQLSESEDSGRWIFRGQASDNGRLKTSFECALNNWGIKLTKGPRIEQQLIRWFRRQYRLADRELVENDTLYCLSLMQHHGAPTRLPDWTYSPFVAAHFAIESGAENAVVWCLNAKWCEEQGKNIVTKEVVGHRNKDSTRNDHSFRPLFMPESPKKRKRFILLENALCLNERQVVQQGVFACPGDVGTTFEANLRAMRDWKSERSILRLHLELKGVELARFVTTLERMNVNSAVLFPGLDGFAKSLKERLLIIEDFAAREVGTENLSM